MRRLWYIIVIPLAVGIIISVFYPTERKRIKKVINKAETAIVEEDIDGLMEGISYNYADDYGNNYLLLRERVQTIFKRLDDVEIEKEVMDIYIDGEEAEAMIRTSVIATEGDDRGYVIGDAVEGGLVRVYLEKSPYKWRIRKVELDEEFKVK